MLAARQDLWAGSIVDLPDDASHTKSLVAYAQQATFGRRLATRPRPQATSSVVLSRNLIGTDAMTTIMPIVRTTRYSGSIGYGYDKYSVRLVSCAYFFIAICVLFTYRLSYHVIYSQPENGLDCLPCHRNLIGRRSGYRSGLRELTPGERNESIRRTETRERGAA